MFISLFSRIIWCVFFLFHQFVQILIVSAWFAFLLPSYATFKALSHRPLSEHELQRWAMYWTVVGAFVAFEYTAEWLISWYVTFFSTSPYLNYTIFAVHLLGTSRLPFYWEAKTIFFLYLSLSQTQVSPRLFLERVA